MKKIIFGLILLSGAVIYYLYYFEGDQLKLTHKQTKDQTTISKDRLPSSIKSMRDQQEQRIIEKRDISHKMFEDQGFEPKSDAGFSTKYQSFFEKQELEINGRQYKRSDEIFTVLEEEYQETMGQEEIRAYGYVFYHPTADSVGIPALLNAKNKLPAVISGRINIKTNSKDNIEKHKKIWGFTIDQTMAHLNIYSVEIPVDQNIFEVMTSLENDQKLQVELEIIEGIPHVK